MMGRADTERGDRQDRGRQEIREMWLEGTHECKLEISWFYLSVRKKWTEGDNGRQGDH